ncbi:MAG: SPFH domain-containing protein [Spirochaetia bacterium]|nr:SPFH domain-containing protein [Spirochaetia bacterium]
MGLWDGAKRQLRSVIEWENPVKNQLFYKWTDNGDEIKNASKLIVTPGHGCIFTYEGKMEGIFQEEGSYELSTANIPFWTTVKKFMQAFESEHKVGIYFFKKTKILDQKWGTSSLIKYMDPQYKFPVALRAFGNYTFRLSDPNGFFVNILGGNSEYFVDDFRSMMSSRIMQPLSDYFAEAQLSYADLDAQREEISQGISKKLADDFIKLGFEITDFRIEGTSFDEDTMNRINRIADMTAEAQAASAVGLNYAQVQQIDAMKLAAQNEGGGAGLGMGLGAGMGFGNMMAGAMAGQMGQPGGTPASEDPMARLSQLKQMLDNGLITQEEFDEKKKSILDKI